MYVKSGIGWYISYASIPINEYIDQLEDNNLKIFISDTGNSFEAECLVSQGFKNVVVIDWTMTALANIKT